MCYRLQQLAMRCIYDLKERKELMCRKRACFAINVKLVGMEENVERILG